MTATQMVDAVREIITNSDSWSHNTATRQIERLLAEYDGTLDEYRERMRRERDRELGLIAKERSTIDRWEHDAKAKYDAALSGVDAAPLGNK